jgi:predicted Zn-dependent protease
MGEVLFRQGRYSEAVKYLKIAKEKNSDEPLFYKFLGNVLLKTGRKSEAINLMEEYLNRFPDDPGNAALRRHLQQLKGR